ncbi:hypothetical protein [Pseudorhodoplanes sp.]|uniref:hypothetical protein n=1 Tax=Pseudorhodoplanes sp. TaxID=1934341 RepID=UPI003D0DC3FD
MITNLNPINQAVSEGNTVGVQTRDVPFREPGLIGSLTETVEPHRILRKVDVNCPSRHLPPRI